MNVIGFDFSINKPAATVFSNNKYSFYIWPYHLADKYVKAYSDHGVNVTNRTDDKDEGKDISSKMRYEVENSKYIANLITESLMSFLNIDTYLSFEGLSYGSGGDRGIQLGAYKYILMSRLSDIVPMKNMYTYSPITIKSVAECAKKGMDKKDMINRFIEIGPDSEFRTALKNTPEIFQSPKAKNWIENVDDIVDSYWAIETLRKKENLESLFAL